MRVWKLEAAREDDWMCPRQGHVLAASRAEALAICQATSGLPYNRVHEKHPAMLWPGPPGETLDWTR